MEKYRKLLSNMGYDKEILDKMSEKECEEEYLEIINEF